MSYCAFEARMQTWTIYFEAGLGELGHNIADAVAPAYQQTSIDWIRNYCETQQSLVSGWCSIFRSVPHLSITLLD